MRIRTSAFRKLWILTLFATAPAWAESNSPPCLGLDGEPMPVNNQQPLKWKTTTPNEYHDRAHVTGTVEQVYPDKTGHHHFQLQIGFSSNETVEIIFNEDFGSTPDIQSGMQVEACGDFINQFAPANGYQPSPDGALIHWVHRSNNPSRHPSGYLIIDGQPFGESF